MKQITISSPSTNHQELQIGGLLAVFSYGKPTAFICGNEIIANKDYFKYSTTTSRHTNASIPELRSSDPDKLLSNEDYMAALSTAIIKELA